MGFTSNQTEVRTDVSEIVAEYSDLVQFFADLGISISNPDQSFRIILRKPSTTGGNQDLIMGDMDSDQKLVIQFTEVTGPTTL